MYLAYGIYDDLKYEFWYFLLAKILLLGICDMLFCLIQSKWVGVGVGGIVV